MDNEPRSTITLSIMHANEVLQARLLRRLDAMRADQKRVVDAWFSGSRAEERAARKAFRARWGVTPDQATALLYRLEAAPLEGDE